MGKIILAVCVAVLGALIGAPIGTVLGNMFKSHVSLAQIEWLQDFNGKVLIVCEIILSLAVLFLLFNKFRKRSHGEVPPPEPPPPPLIPPPPGDEPPPDPEKGKVRWEPDDKSLAYKRGMYVAWGVAYVTVFAVAYFAGGSIDTNSTEKTSWLKSFIWWIALFGVIIHFGLSLLRNVPAGMTGAGFLRGKPIAEYEHGLALIPYGIGELKTITRKIIKINVGTLATNREDKPDENVILSDVIYRESTPRRVRFPSLREAIGGYGEGEDPFLGFKLPNIDDESKKRLSDNPINLKEAITEPRCSITVQVRSAVFFFINMDSIEELVNMVAAETFGAFDAIAARVPFGLAREIKGVIEARIRLRLEEIVGERKERLTGIEHPSFGLDIVNFSILDWGVHHDVNKASKKASEAGINKQTTITDAEGRSEASKLDGKAAAANRRAFLEEEAVGLEAERVLMTKQGGYALAQLQAATEAVKASKHTLITTPGANPVLAGLELISNRLGGDNIGRPTPGQPEPRRARPVTQKGQAGQQEINPPPPETPQE